jgi:mannose PTS system EIID component
MAAADPIRARDDVPAPETPAPTPVVPPTLPFEARLEIFTRLLAIQGSWNYELLLGTGIAFCTDPALRRLPGGPGGVAYRASLAGQSRYFNAHP